MIVRNFDIDEEEWDEFDEDDADATEPCPGCGEPIDEDAQQCPDCGLFLTREDRSHRKPWWVTLGVLTCLGMVIWWILHP